MRDAVSLPIESVSTAARPRHWAALIMWSIWTVVVGAVALSLWLSLDQGGPIVLSPSSVGEVVAVAIVLVLPYATIGAMIASRQPPNALGWIFIAIAVFAAVNLVSSTYGNYAQPRDLEFSAALAGTSEITWFPSLALLVTLVPLMFPTGRPPSRRWNWVLWVTAAGILLILVPGAFDGWQQRELIVRGATELEDPDVALFAPIIAGALLLLVALLGAFASLAVRFRRARGKERDQLKWFLFGISIVAAIVVLQVSVELPLILERAQWLCTLTLPITMAIAILRHGLFDIDVIISRTLVWTILSGFVVAAYVLIVGLLGSQFQDTDNLVWSLLATGLVALLFQPVRSRAQRLVNRFVYGDRDDPYAAIAKLGRRLDGVVSPSEILPAVVESVAAALKLPYVGLSLLDGQLLVPAASVGAPLSGASMVTLPLTYNTEPVGELVLCPRTPAETLTPADLALLGDLARQIGVAAHAVRLNTDLRRSRERLVVAQEEERRRIRNDLHDGLGPVLSGLKLRSETARNLVGDNPEVEALLADIADRTETAVVDIRRLVYSLRPPTLDDLGFAGAVQELARQATTPVTVEIAPPPAALPAAVEVAAFRIVQESLTNIDRHAGATSGAISVHLERDALVVVVTDDGGGPERPGPGGIGLQSMRERATELGGTVVVDALPQGGMRVTATLPTGPDPHKAQGR